MSHDIIVVDDDPDTREILNIVLGTLELPIRQASNGREALEEIAKEPPLLLMLDLTMPELDGPGVLEAIRVNPVMASIPTLVFTASVVDADLIARLQLPAHHIIRKGNLSMTHLRELVIRLLGNEVPDSLRNSGL